MARAFSRPERIRLSLFDDPSEGVPLDLASRRDWLPALIFGAFFLGFAAIAVQQIGAIGGSPVETVFDLSSVLFQIFWVLGWSTAVAVLFLITVLLLFYTESTRLTPSRLVHVPRLGPLRIVMEYELARIRRPRMDRAEDPDRVRVRFDYGGETVTLGSSLSRAGAERFLGAIQEAGEERSPGAIDAAGEEGGAEMGPGDRAGDGSAGGGDPSASALGPAGRAPEHGAPGSTAASPSWTSASVLALVLANLVPLIGVVALGWDLGEVMVLFWAESGIVGFYSLLRLAFVAGWSALFLGPFFLGHFGGFMAGHFLFIYGLFVQGVDAEGIEPGAFEALEDLFMPLLPALLALLASHGVSFVTNFLRRKEFVGRDASDQMKEPYRRIVVMHLTIIFGGWLILLLGTPVWALALLLVLKTGVDLRAHRREHARGRA